jgi:hypothetical protein
MYVDKLLVGNNYNKLQSSSDTFSTEVWSMMFGGKLSVSTAILLGLITETQSGQASRSNVQQYMSSAERKILGWHDQGLYTAGSYSCPTGKVPDPAVINATNSCQ